MVELSAHLSRRYGRMWIILYRTSKLKCIFNFFLPACERKNNYFLRCALNNYPFLSRLLVVKVRVGMRHGVVSRNVLPSFES